MARSRSGAPLPRREAPPLWETPGAANTGRIPAGSWMFGVDDVSGQPAAPCHPERSEGSARVAWRVRQTRGFVLAFRCSNSTGHAFRDLGEGKDGMQLDAVVGAALQDVADIEETGTHHLHDRLGAPRTPSLRGKIGHRFPRERSARSRLTRTLSIQKDFVRSSWSGGDFSTGCRGLPHSKSFFTILIRRGSE